MRVLQRAVEALGSERALAHELRVPLRDLASWLDGSERPTRDYFLAAVDLLIESSDISGLERLHSLEPGHVDPLDSLNAVGANRSKTLKP